ncbi:hypothetical protein Tco_0438515 [Tanacetum coccineum]
MALLKDDLAKGLRERMYNISQRVVHLDRHFLNDGLIKITSANFNGMERRAKLEKTYGMLSFAWLLANYYYRLTRKLLGVVIQRAKLLRENVFILDSDGALMSTQEYMQKVIEDVGEDDDFNSGRVKSVSPNVLGDLNVTMKDLSRTIPGTIHHKVIGEGGNGKDITVGVYNYCKGGVGSGCVFRWWGFQWLYVLVVAQVSTVMRCHDGDGRGLVVVVGYCLWWTVIVIVMGFVAAKGEVVAEAEGEQNPGEGSLARSMVRMSETESVGLELDIRQENQERIRMPIDELRKYTSSMLKYHDVQHNRLFVEKKREASVTSRTIFVNSLRLILKRSRNNALSYCGCSKKYAITKRS